MKAWQLSRWFEFWRIIPKKWIDTRPTVCCVYCIAAVWCVLHVTHSLSVWLTLWDSGCGWNEALWSWYSKLCGCVCGFVDLKVILHIGIYRVVHHRWPAYFSIFRSNHLKSSKTVFKIAFYASDFTRNLPFFLKNSLVNGSWWIMYANVSEQKRTFKCIGTWFFKGPLHV
jgi:hypothetical protein